MKPSPINDGLSGSLLSNLADAHVLVWHWDILAQGFTCSQAIETIFQYPQKTIGSDINWWYACVHADDRERVRSTLESLLKSDAQTWVDEYRLIRGDQSIAAVLSQGYVERNRKGNPINLIAVTLDITQHSNSKQAFEEQSQSLLKQALAEKAKAEAASNSKNQFLALMSHELRTPLHTIISATNACLEGYLGPLNDKQTEYLSLVSQSSDHLLGIINNILDIAKIEAGKLVLEYDTIDLQSFIQQAVGIVEPLMKERGQEFTIELAESLPLVFSGDFMRLKQALCNLLSNAYKFTPEGGKITLRCYEVTKKELVFSVIDEGYGIHEDHLEQIFQPFEQVASNHERNIKGTGLGLPLAKQIVALHGGTIDVSSCLGQGSTFTIRIPHLSNPSKKPSTSKKA